jgi:uncharacterized membrane protein
MTKNTDVNDPENYKWGLFYFNPDDLRGVVPKRNRRMGWTLNFAQPLAWVIILGIIAFAVIMSRFGN